MAKKTSNDNVPTIVGLTLVTNIELHRARVHGVLHDLMEDTTVWSRRLTERLTVKESIDNFLDDSSANLQLVASWLAATFSGVTVDQNVYDILTEAENVWTFVPKAWRQQLNASFTKSILPAMKEWATAEKVKSFEAEKARAAAEQTELIAKVRALGYEVTPIAKKK